MPMTDAERWARSIRSLSQNRRYRDAVILYVRMQQNEIPPSTYAVTSALKSCARIAEKMIGTAIHAQTQKYGFESDVYVQTCLVDLYSRLGDIFLAQKLFDAMSDRNVTSWNSILNGYLKSGNLTMAKKIFDSMKTKDVISWNCLISGYAKHGDIDSAEALFRIMPMRNIASWNAMLSGYVDCGSMEKARDMFYEMPERNSISCITMISGYSERGDIKSARDLFDRVVEKDQILWNAIIACYAQNNHPREALQLFDQMRKHRTEFKPDKMTLVSVISACSQLGDLRFGSWVEGYMRKVGIEMDDHLKTALIDLYAKCGCIDRAFVLFNCLKRKDIVSYSAMIFGCGINGKAFDSIKLFKDMMSAKIKPNSITFNGLLIAYNHAGLVEDGLNCFKEMINECQISPTVDHYAIMIDLLGRSGRLDEAHELIRSMPMEPHSGVWGALLLASLVHGNVKVGEIAAQNCLELQPDATGYYVLLANIYASANRWDDAKKLRKIMSDKGLVKLPGCSWMDSL